MSFLAYRILALYICTQTYSLYLSLLLSFSFFILSDCGTFVCCVMHLLCRLFRLLQPDLAKERKRTLLFSSTHGLYKDMNGGIYTADLLDLKASDILYSISSNAPWVDAPVHSLLLKLETIGKNIRSRSSTFERHFDSLNKRQKKEDEDADGWIVIPLGSSFLPISSQRAHRIAYGLLTIEFCAPAVLSS